MKQFCLVLILILALALPALADNTEDNPSPLPEDLILPLPQGRTMVFRPVFMGQGAGPFAQRSFRMGDPEGGFKEHPTEVSLSGSFLVPSKSDWCYYLAKYEVTLAQWAAVNGLPAPPADQGGKPVTGISWFEAQAFLDTLNLWLFANALEKLPKSGESAGFLRLPTEAEWEFAARGGAAVPADAFDRRVPYEGGLGKAEWFAGPTSSHGKLKAVGRLLPNPLGLHDMLGNATEMTLGLYMIEYYQGRPGGFVARGGHYLSSENRLRSSLRTEEPFYLTGGAPNKKPTMGFRPVLAAVVFGDRASVQAYEAGWETYRSGAGAATPAAVSTAPTSQKSQVNIDQAGQYLGRLEKLAQGDPSMLQELGRLKSVIADLRFIQAKADAETAHAWFKIASERGYFIHLESQKLPTLQKLIEAATAGQRQEMVEKLTARKVEIEANLAQAMENYTESLRQLDTLDPEARQIGHDRYLKFLLAHDAAGQVRAAKLVAKHLAALSKTKRTAPREWQEELSTLGI